MEFAFKEPVEIKQVLAEVSVVGIQLDFLQHQVMVHLSRPIATGQQTLLLSGRDADAFMEGCYENMAERLRPYIEATFKTQSTPRAFMSTEAKAAAAGTIPVRSSGVAGPARVIESPIVTPGVPRG